MSKYTPEEKMRIARVRLQDKSPFYATLALKLKMVEDESVGTAGVDCNNRIYYSPTFVSALTTDELIWLWAHELGHLIFFHLELKGKRNHLLWNIACDIAINLILEKDGIGKRIADVYYDEKYLGWTASAIYLDLMKNEKGNMQKFSSLGGSADNHGKWAEGTAVEQEKTGKEWHKFAVQAAHAAKAAGKEVPEAFRGLISDLTETKITWKDLVRSKALSHKKSEVSWNTVNRRRKLGDFYYPGVMPGKKVEFAVGIDVSGSFTQEDVAIAMSEVYSAAKEFEEVTIHVFQWDTRVYGHKIFTKENMEEMLTYEMQGGGGTDFNCVINWMRGENIIPKELFVFTDLYFSFMPDPNICPTTFIVVGSKESEGPYGDTIKYDSIC